MKKFFKFAGLGLAGLMLLAVLGVTFIFILVGSQLSERHEIDVSAVPVPSSAETIAEGERLARLRGCNDGCHGKAGQGQVFFELPDGSKVVAPGLRTLAAEADNRDLVRAIRHGIGVDGRSLIGIMPSSMLYHLNDEDLGAILAWMSSDTPQDESLPETWLGPLIRLMIFKFQMDGNEIMAFESFDHDAPRIPKNSDDPVAFGRYLAATTCTECHGDHLQGRPSEGMPPLAVAKAYSEGQFIHLMRTSEPMSGEKLDLMAGVAVNRFKHFTEDEVSALYAYLQARNVGEL